MTLGPRAHVVSSYTIIKGAAVDETYAVFRDWDFGRTVDENLAFVRETNSIGAPTANWLHDVCKVIHRRYDPEGRDRPLVELARAGCAFAIWKPLALWHMTRDEYLLRTFLQQWLYPRYEDGTVVIRTADLFPFLDSLHPDGHVAGLWAPTTRSRVASGLLKIATDFRLLQGSQTRTFAGYHLPEQALLYVLHALAEDQRNARQVVHSPEWRLYLMAPEDVERELLRLHQFRTVQYEVAGSLAQLTLPCASAAAYAAQELAA